MNETLKQILYRIVTSRPVLRVARPMGLYPVPGSHSRQLLDVLLHKRINCILDVGAHYGEFGSLLRKVGYDGHIFSFEPVSNSFKRLSSCAAGDGKWNTFNFALGAADESAEMNLYESDFFSSMLAPSGEAVRFRSHMEGRGTETVSIRRLDSILNEITEIVPSPRIFLKMDTQGYDIQVFRGARDALSF